jgi:hypothetical protein
LKANANFRHRLCEEAAPTKQSHIEGEVDVRVSRIDYRSDEQKYAQPLINHISFLLISVLSSLRWSGVYASPEFGCDLQSWLYDLDIDERTCIPHWYAGDQMNWDLAVWHMLQIEEKAQRQAN